MIGTQRKKVRSSKKLEKFNPVVKSEIVDKLKQVVYVNLYERNIANNPVKEIADKLTEVSYIASQHLNINNIFYNEKFTEVIVAQILGHEINLGTRDPDAFDGEKWIEYKSINLSTEGPKSFQFHWLSNAKLLKFKKLDSIYFIIRDNAIILEIWKLNASVFVEDMEKTAKKSEAERILLGKAKNINAHKSYSLDAIKKKGARLVYKRHV